MMDKRRIPMGNYAILVIAAVLLCSSPLQTFVGPQEAQQLQINDYRIGPKDLLEINVFELPELNQTVRVSEDGSITLSLLGKVEVGKLTAQELEQKLVSLLNQQFTKEAHVTVFIREYQKISVIGAVGRPGMYEIIGPTTLLQIIAQAGGLAASATKEISVFRLGRDGEQTHIIVNWDELMFNGRPDLNIELQPQDVVAVPIDQTLNVFVYGEVQRPGVVTFLSSRKITLLQAIAQAGGTTPWAKKTRVTIKRRDKTSGREIQIRVNIKAIINNKNTDVFLEEGDVIIVP